MKRFEDKIVLVTGASKGLGVGCASLFAAEGATVVVNYNRDEEGAASVVDQIRRTGGKAIAIRASVAIENDVTNMFRSVEDEFGRLDVLVNNAGVFRPGPIDAVTTDDFRWHFDTNVLGMFLCVQKAIKLFPEAGAAIVNIGSTASTAAPAGGALYSASKAAVTALTKSLAKELAPRNVRVNAVNPGYVPTEGVKAAGLFGNEFERHMVATTPLARSGRVDEIAASVTFLASAEASYITGEILVVSGGASM